MSFARKLPWGLGRSSAVTPWASSWSWTADHTCCSSCSGVFGLAAFFGFAGGALGAGACLGGAAFFGAGVGAGSFAGTAGLPSIALLLAIVAATFPAAVCGSATCLPFCQWWPLASVPVKPGSGG